MHTAKGHFKEARLRVSHCVLSLLGVALASAALSEAQAPVGVRRSPRFAQRKTTEPAYWVGHSGGYVYRWTKQDLTATDATTKRPVYSVTQALKQEFGKPEPDDSGFSHYEVRFVPLSVVGSLLSYERDDYWEGGAHPSGNETFVTVDVRAPKHGVKLTDLFPAEQIRQALLADRIVRRVLAREKIAAPTTLDGLVKALANKEFGGEEDSMYRFPEALLEDFAFHHIEGENVAVRFLLPHGTELYRFRHTQLGLLLPIPARLKSAFAQAEKGKAGALMQTLQRITARRESTFIVVGRKADRR